jgi:SAM-dependent methyltransferase
MGNVGFAIDKSTEDLLQEIAALNNKLKLQSRAGWEEMEKEINDRGKHLGGCWLPYTSGSHFPALITALVTVFGVRNVLDVGCGGGEALRHFRALGCQVVGIEGLNYCASRCQVPVICHDLEQSPVRMHNLDLVYSIECAEHISNEKNYLDTICQGKLLCMTAAGPLQGGHNHVNCQTSDYWIKKISERGYVYQTKLTEMWRPMAGGYFGQNGMFFVRQSAMDEYGLERGDYK